MLGLFSRLDPHVQRVSGWLTVGGIALSALYTGLAITAPLFQDLNWAGATLIGIGLALVTMLALSLVLVVVGYGFRLIRPQPAVPDGSANLPFLDHKPPAYDDTALRKKVETAVEDVTGQLQELLKTVKPALESQTKMNDAFRERLDALAAASDQNKAGIEATLSSLGESQKYATKEIKDIHDTIRLMDRDAQKAEETRKTEKEKQQEALHAVYQREILGIIAGEIDRLAAELYDQLRAGEAYDAQRWVEWEKAHSQWEIGVRKWVENGRWYAPQVEARTYTIDDAKYASDWTVKDQQFPNSEAVRRFKKFRIIHSQWDEVRRDVDRGVVQVAFCGLTSEDMRRRPVQ